MTIVTVLFILAILFGLYVAWNIGANDVANAVGTSVGSGALTLKQAVLIAAVFEFCGAYFLGSNVSETLEAGIVNSAYFEVSDYIFGMLGALLATGVWLQIASFCGWPVSTTHSIVGAVMGFGLSYGNFNAVYWGELGSIALSWVVSPLLGGSLAFLIFTVIRREILYHPRPIKATKRLTPYFVFAVFFALSLIIFFGGLGTLNLKLGILESVGLAFIVGIITAVISYFLVQRVAEKCDITQKPDEDQVQNMGVLVSLRKAQRHLSRVEAATFGDMHEQVEKLVKQVSQVADNVKVEDSNLSHSEYRVVERIFIYLQIITACFMAFAHGSNDVANAIGPLSAIINLLQGHGTVYLQFESVEKWLLLLGGIGIVAGLATWGWRVIETVGKKITELTPSRGFAAGFAAAVTIVLASKLGLPISTTHVIVGAVLGVGFARGIGAINLNTIRDIVVSWIVTVPAGAILSAIFFYILRAIFTS